MNDQGLGTLFVCATPIGNLQDCSFRLIDTLKMVHLIASEDTRKTTILLQHFHIKKPLLSLQKYNEKDRISTILMSLKQGKNIALVSDAGTPNIADPGALLVSTLRAEGVSIVPIPGPSAITALLSVSGVLGNQFYFGGFFPKSKNDQESLLHHATLCQVPLVCFETAKRLEKTLLFLDSLVPDSHIVLGKELSKTFETFFSGSLHDIVASLDTITIKGEWCFVLAPSNQPLDTPDLDLLVKELSSLHLNPSQIKGLAPLLGVRKNALYTAYLKALNSHD